MWLRVKDEDIHEAKQLRVAVSSVEEGKRKKLLFDLSRWGKTAMKEVS